MSRTEHVIEVAAASEGERIDRFLADKLGLSRAKLKELFEAGSVRVGGRRAKKGEMLKAGQSVSVAIAPEGTALVPQPDAPLTVLYQDEALVFLDKPAHVPVHPLRPDETGTLANALVGRFAECAQASTDEREAGFCHRLDVETSGVIVAARSRAAWESVRQAFTDRRVDKHYWALVAGPIADEGKIDLPLRHRADHVEPAVDGLDAREAVSQFRVLGRHRDEALVEVQILTGVLHQVRAHLAAIGAPIVGDSLYGGRPDDNLGRFFLHARSLALVHPVTHRRVRVESPLPAALRERVSWAPAVAAAAPAAATSGATTTPTPRG